MEELQRKFIIGLALLALFGTVTNYVYFSPLLTLLVPLAIFAFNKESLPRPIAWLFLFLALFLLSTLLYHPRSLIEFGFYRRDGNFIISYAPLFVLPLFVYRYDLKQYIRYFYLFAVALYSLLFAWHLLTIGGASSIHELVFGGLFLAQNAVGGFLSVLGALGFAYYYNRRTKKELFFFIVVFIILVSTYSRGSILGLILGIIAWYFATTRRFKMLAALMTIPVLFTIGTLMIGYPYFKSEIGPQTEVEIEIGKGTEVKNYNVLLRIFYTFPRAYYLFKQSPIVGTGVGSYDDRPLKVKHIAPYVAYNAQPKHAHTDAHAHHTYLHILAEQGILGLAAFLTFWISLGIYLMNIRGSPVMRDYLLVAYFTLTFAGFTEHRMTTPSNMLPFTISVGLFMLQKKSFTTYVLQKTDN